ncbi:Toll/interleukin-1 receptor domain-containing protein [Tanacetum coccineum]
MRRRLSATPDFNGLPRLQKLELNQCYELEEIHPSHGNHRSLKSVHVSYCYKLRMFPTIVEWNNSSSHIEYSHKSFSSFPEFQANMKCLVKLDVYGIHALLSSIGERCTNLIYLRIGGLEIPKQFTNRLYAVDRCRLPLQENWCNDFCGFLICAVLEDHIHNGTYPYITIKEEASDDIRGMLFHDVVWGESFGGKLTWVWYVSFASLRRTEWWNPTHKNVSFYIHHRNITSIVIGASLVPMNNGSGMTDTSTDSSEFTDDYTPKISIRHDSKFSLTISPLVYDEFGSF